jgi:hypothetical protein
MTPEFHGGRQADGDAIAHRFRLLAGLMWDLRGLGRGSLLHLGPEGEPVLRVVVGWRARLMAVLVVRGADCGWTFLWEGGRMAPADGTLSAARQIAEVER